MQTRIIQVYFEDFSNPEAVKELYAKFDTIDVDVSVLVNNNGLASFG